MTGLRPFVRRLHFIATAVFGLFAIAVGLSGSALVFRPELERALYEPRVVAGATTLSLDTLRERAASVEPTRRISMLILPDRPDRLAQFILQKRDARTLKEADQIAVYVNPTHPEGRGSRGRTPFFTQTDFFLQYGVKVGKEMRVTASANITNVFDQDTTRSVFPGILLGSAATTPVPVATYFAPGGYNYQAVIAAIPAANKDARFMKAQLFQAPRALRLGLTLDF